MNSSALKNHPTDQRRITTVVIGSNDIRLAHRQYINGEMIKTYAPAHITNMMCALGEGMSDTNHMISDKNIDLASKILTTYADYLWSERQSPEDTIGMATWALRNFQKTESGPQVIQDLQKAFYPYTFKIFSEKEEAELAGATVKIDRHYLQNVRNHDSVSFIELGGGSMQYGRIPTKNGNIVDAISIPYGRHPLMALQAAHPEDPHAIQTKLWEIFASNNLPKSDILCIVGSQGDTVRTAMCHDNEYVLRGKNNIRKTLLAAAHRSADEYSQHINHGVRKYSEYVPLTAHITEVVTSYFGAGKLIFTQTKTSDAQALLHYNESLKRTPPVLPQPSYPLGLEQALPA